jgi:hypothetical protein
MSRCVLCAQPTLGREDVCGFHLYGHETDWATGNRIICDFLHRGIVRGASPERFDAFDVLIETLDEALVP